MDLSKSFFEKPESEVLDLEKTKTFLRILRLWKSELQQNYENVFVLQINMYYICIILFFLQVPKFQNIYAHI